MQPQTFGMAYDTEEEGARAEFMILAQLRKYIKTHTKKDGTFVKTLTVNIPDVMVEEISRIVTSTGEAAKPNASKIIIN